MFVNQSSLNVLEFISRVYVLSNFCRIQRKTRFYSNQTRKMYSRNTNKTNYTLYIILHGHHLTSWCLSTDCLSVSQYIMHPFPLLGYINFKWHLNPEPTGPGHSLQYMYRPSPSSIARGYTADMGTILLKRVTTSPISSTSMFYFIVFH